MHIKNTEIRIIKGDITRSDTQAIVIPVNSDLRIVDGLAGAVKRRAGKEAENELLKKQPVRIGEAVWTVGGKLKSEYIIYPVIGEVEQGTFEAILRHACVNSLRHADHLQVKTLALPALGGEADVFPVVGAAKIMAQEIIKYLRREESGIEEIVFCLPNTDLYRSYEQTISGYVSHIQDRLGEGPYVTVDIIIEMEGQVVLVERSNPPYGWALPGGFVDYGESLETAARREAKEETHLDLMHLEQFRTYSDPDRDPRFHTISTVFVAQGKGQPQSGDDAKNLKLVAFEDLSQIDFAFDHKRIVEDYLKHWHDFRS